MDSKQPDNPVPSVCPPNFCPPNFTQVPVPRNFPPETLLSPPYLPHLSRYLPHMSPYLPQSFGSRKLSHRVSLIDGAGTFRNSLSTKLRPSRPERHGQLTGQPSFARLPEKPVGRIMILIILDPHILGLLRSPRVQSHGLPCLPSPTHHGNSRSSALRAERNRPCPHQ